MLRFNLHLSLTIIVLLSACRKVDERPNWDVDIYSPILNTSLSLVDIVPDSLVQLDADQSIRLVYKNKLFTYALDSFLTLPNKSIQKKFSIDNLVIDDETIEHNMTLGDIARQQGLAGAIILANHGNSIPISAMNGLSAPPFDVDATSYFTEMVLSEGKMDISIENQLPIDCDSIIYNFKNKNLGNIIIQDTFEQIPSGSASTHTFLLDTTELEGMLVAELLNFNTPGAPSGAMIDTNNAIKISVTIYDLKLESATAYFPTQNLVDDSNDIEIEGLDAELTQAIAKSGDLLVEVISTAEDTIFFEYSLPAVKKNGTSFFKNDKMAPAIPGDTTHLYLTYPMDGYDFDLTGRTMDTFNSFYSTMVASLEESGKLISISKQDSFILNFSFKDLKPSYVKGYFGQDTLSLDDVTSIEDFGEITSNNLQFEDINIELEIENGIGIDGIIKLQTLCASNNSQSLNLSHSLIGSNINIDRAIETPFQPSFTSLLIDNSNSNIVSMLNLLPNSLSCSGEIQINPNGNTLSHQDFATDQSKIEANLNINMPLSFVASDLQLSEEFNFDLANSENADKIKEANFIFNIENGYPLDTRLKLIFSDDVGALDSIDGLALIKAADINSLGRVTQNKNSKIDFFVNPEKMQKIMQSKYVKCQFSFDTKPAGQNLKIYSDYRIGLKLIADFKYHHTLQ